MFITALLVTPIFTNDALACLQAKLHQLLLNLVRVFYGDVWVTIRQRVDGFNVNQGLVQLGAKLLDQVGLHVISS